MTVSGRIDGFRDQMVRAGEIRMHAVVGGKGPPLVLLHGFPQTWWEWSRMMPRLAETHTVVAVDLRGQAIRIARRAAMTRQRWRRTSML